MGEKEFIINPFLTVRLENRKTTIYVKGELFSQCKYLFIIDPENTVKEEINSIDDAQAMMGWELEEEIKPEDLGIIPEEEFWGHCSNLQAWAEYGYDTRLLHSNLSFPLLKRLTEVGDPKARRVFKEEIVKRYYEGNENVRTFLRSEGYLEYVSRDELWSPIKSDTEVIKELERRSLKEFAVFRDFDLRDYEIISLNLSFKGIHTIPESLTKLVHLEELKVDGPEHSTIPEWIGKMTSLKRLDMTYWTASLIPEGIGDLRNLEYFRIYGPHLKVIPESIGNLKNLRELWIGGEALENIPEGIGGLESLEELHINRTSIRTLPDSIGNLKNLKMLSLSENKLESIPETIGDLDSVKKMYFGINCLKEIPKTIGNLHSLIDLSFNANQIEEVPVEIANAKNLGEFWINRNPVSNIPGEILWMKSLWKLDIRNTNIELSEFTITQINKNRKKKLRILV